MNFQQSCFSGVDAPESVLSVEICRKVYLTRLVLNSIINFRLGNGTWRTNEQFWELVMDFGKSTFLIFDPPGRVRGIDSMITANERILGLDANIHL